MIIPISNKKIKIGDYVVLTDYIVGNYYAISIGHKFLVVDFDSEYSIWICMDEETQHKFRIDGKYLSVIVDIDSAEREFIYLNEVEEYCKYLKDNCPHRDSDWMFDGCLLREDVYGDSCEPRLECAKYLDDVSGCRSLVKHLREDVYGDSCEPRLECAKYLDDVSGCRSLVKHLRMNKLYKIQERE